jgi:anaerobic magnesium-protoporphyrin IX monomethyl ester cyclase
MTAESSAKPRVVLFNPSPWHEGPYCGLPLALLAVSALPHSKGYPVTIVTQDVDDDPEAQILEACADAVVFGVTSLTGTMIAKGLEMCAKVRERYPDLTIVWGGTHPSIAPEQTCQHPLVDVVVAGQGEATFMELVETLEAGDPLDDVKGLYFERDGAVVSTGLRPTIDIDTLPSMPFDLLDMERYIMLHSSAMHARLRGKRAVTYYSSYGCPFSCSFCSEPKTSNRRWYAKSPEKVISELETLVNDFGVEVVVFEDPIYFIDVKRVRRISEMMLERGLKLVWSATSRLEAIKKIDAETWDILERSGFMQVFIGIESASPTVLKAVGKKYTADDIVEVAKILDDHDVILTGSFIQGIPVKTTDRTLEEICREDMKLASETFLRIYEVNPKATIYVVMYTPYPGSAAYQLSLDNGVVPPESLDGWQHFIHANNQTPWLLREQEVFVRSSQIARKVLRGRDRQMKRFRRKKVEGSIMMAYSAITRARYRHGYFKYPIEQHLMAKLAKRAMGSRNPDGQNNGMMI